VSWGRKVARRIATALAIKLALRLLARIGMGAAIASYGWAVGIAVSLALLVVEEAVIVAVDRLHVRYTSPDERNPDGIHERNETPQGTKG